MAELFIAECSVLQKDGGMRDVQAPKMPPIASDSVTIGAASAQSAVFDDATTMIRVKAKAACHLEFGAEPTATNTSVIALDAGDTEYFGVTAGERVAVIEE